MAVVQGVKEKVHLPIYDSLNVEPQKQLRDVETSSTLKFFVNVQGKTKLETNLQSASLLPHYNTFEARAMRVVISDLPAEFPDKPTVSDEGLDVTDADGNLVDFNGNVEGDAGFVAANAVTADFELGLNRLMELLKEARDSDDRSASLPADDEDVTLKKIVGGNPVDLSDTEIDNVVGAGGVILLSISDLEGYLKDITEKNQPPKEQIRPNDGAGTIISKLIYNTVTTLYVGEKIMIQMPTWFFPSGAGAYSEGLKFTTHGEPSPTATFRFAEPIYIDKQQNFRVEIEIPDADVLKDIQKIYGPLNIWVVLDGYMTRDVQ
jgi:hypothetical protein